MIPGNIWVSTSVVFLDNRNSQGEGYHPHSPVFLAGSYSRTPQPVSELLPCELPDEQNLPYFFPDTH
jgi:hypothetical protein